jgi:hypothetical protein
MKSRYSKVINVYFMLIYKEQLKIIMSSLMATNCLNKQ